MTSQQSRRERASSDKAQAVQDPIPKRPSLPNRTNSAPVGALQQVTTTKMAPSTGQHKVGQQTVIEEDHSPTATSSTATSSTATSSTATTAATTTTKTGPATASSGKPAVSSRVGDEVCFCRSGDTGIWQHQVALIVYSFLRAGHLKTRSSPCDNSRYWR